jgi:hypothetical protein
MFSRILTVTLLTLITLSFTAPAQMQARPGPTPPKPAAATPARAPAPAPPESEEADDPAPKARPLPFQGKVSHVNKAARTFTITTKEGKQHVFHITDQTKIEKADGAATIDDIAKDEIVRGSRLKLADYKWEAKKVIIGAKEPGAEPARGKRKQKD